VKILFNDKHGVTLNFIGNLSIQSVQRKPPNHGENMNTCCPSHNENVEPSKHLAIEREFSSGQNQNLL
jgi:hypothetical protein